VGTKVYISVSVIHTDIDFYRRPINTLKPSGNYMYRQV